MRINPLSEKRTSSSSHKVRVVLSSRKTKKKNNQGRKGNNAHQANKTRDQNNNSSNVYQTDSTIIFASIANILSPIHSYSSNVKDKSS